MYFLLINVFIGGALALMNGTPIKSGMVTNDGYNAFSLGKNKAAININIASKDIVASNSINVNPLLFFIFSPTLTLVYHNFYLSNAFFIFFNS